ncbi:MAG: anhydro-N-acetylmuramic acid kinase [Rubricoccaceae bacterium]|nr:anhydro-N-acetylmuramic acid kinase [Rubricoccaceae bacterium]
MSEHPLASLIGLSERNVVGLMSGTSLDGVDVAVVRLSGSGADLSVELLGFKSEPYDPALRSALEAACAVHSSHVKQTSQLHVRLAHTFAEATLHLLEEIGLTTDDIHLVGSHGQTVYHIPDSESLAGMAVRSSLQIGDPSTLAVQLDTPVIADFRATDMALGGQGAPLASYFDYAYFADRKETRGLLNLGGIGNLTILPSGKGSEHVYAFDTGPANMLMDALAQRLFNTQFDDRGKFAAAGTPKEGLVDRLLEEAFFQREPPKSTGRELFGPRYVERLLRDGPTGSRDLLATAMSLTVRSIHDAYTRFVAKNHKLDVLIASGGGTRNTELMRQLAEAFDPVPVKTTADYGIDPDAKEAILFAVLAHEWANGVPTNIPRVTGASRGALLGSLTMP